jgi:hypothetical protein
MLWGFEDFLDTRRLVVRSRRTGMNTKPSILDLLWDNRLLLGEVHAMWKRNGDSGVSSGSLEQFPFARDLDS